MTRHGLDLLEANPLLYDGDSRIWSIVEPSVDTSFLRSADDVQAINLGMIEHDPADRS